ARRTAGPRARSPRSPPPSRTPGAAPRRSSSRPFGSPTHAELGPCPIVSGRTLFPNSIGLAGPRPDPAQPLASPEGFSASHARAHGSRQARTRTHTPPEGPPRSLSMPAVYPFRAVQYHKGSGDVSALVAPPYDVLDADSKAALLAK